MELLVALIVGLGIIVGCLCRGHGSIGALELAVEQCLLDFGEELAFGHLVVEVDIELVDDAGDLCADIHRCHRLHGAGGGDDFRHRGRLYSVGLQLHFRFLGAGCRYQEGSGR